MKKGKIVPEIQFPILTIGKNNIVSMSRTETRFTTWTKSVAKNKDYYKSLIIIDSNGYQYRIEDLKIAGYTNPLWGLNVFLNQSVYVNIELSPIEKLTLESIKKISLKAAKANEDSYISAGISLQHIKEDVKNATDIKTTLAALRL